MEKSAFKFEARPIVKEWMEASKNGLNEILASYKKGELASEKLKPITKKDCENLAVILENGDDNKKNNFIEKYKEVEPFLKQIEWQQEFSRRILSSREEDINNQTLENFYDMLIEKKGADESIVSGIGGVNGVCGILEKQGYELRFSDKLEDALAKVDIFARHPSRPSVYWLIQIKSNVFFKDLAVGEAEIFLKQPRAAGSKLTRDLKILKQYCEVLNGLYKERFVPVFFWNAVAKRQGFY